jgi:hypothetical protein
MVCDLELLLPTAFDTSDHDREHRYKLELLPGARRAKTIQQNCFLTCLAVVRGVSVGYGSTAIITSSIPHCWLFIRSRKGYKLPLLKGRFYGQESKKAARMEFKRGPRSESDGAQEDACG